MTVKISKILNNNAVIILDEGQEKIAIGAGVGFNKTKNDLVANQKIEKLFVLKENEKLQQLIVRIPEEHLLLTEEIIKYAENYLNTSLNDHVLLMLADHISFAIEREQEGIHLKNKLLQEIKILYRKEYEIGLWSIDLIKRKLQLNMPADEAAFIALHLHTMKIKGGDIKETIRQTSIVRKMIDLIKDCVGVDIEEEDIAYERLVSHLRFALLRTNEYDGHAMDIEILNMIKIKYRDSFNCAAQVANKVREDYKIEFPEEELGYITLHIERLKQL